MPPVAVARNVRLLVAVLAAVLAAGCGDGDPREASDASPSAPSDGGSHDAAPPPEPMDASTPTPPWLEWLDAASGFDWEGEACWLRITAQCDGPEDCPLAAGGWGECCARIMPTARSYTAIECATACDYRETFPLCHDGQACTDASRVCRTSVVIPNESIGICATPRLNSEPTPPKGREVSGEIYCGAERCIVGVEQCCMREGFDLDRLRSVPHESYCAPIGEPCDCSEGNRPPRDAGPLDEDAG